MPAQKIDVGFRTDHAMSRVAAWPSVRRERADCRFGTALSVGGRQVVHFHADGAVELRLTWPVIRRLRRPLLECGRVRMAPGGDWIRMRLDADSDVDLFVSLASVAIKAGAPSQMDHGRTRWTGSCMTMTRKKIKDAMLGRRPAVVPDDLREPRLRR